MLVTAAEAETKWCSPAVVNTPASIFDSGSGEYTVAILNPQDPTTPAAGRANCIHSDCMSWRWFDPSSDGSDRRGYCGRAGDLVSLEQRSE